MSSSYSSLDWVLSHWAHFAVPRFICVYLCVFCVFSFYTAYLLYMLAGVYEHGEVDLMGLKPNPYDHVFIQCFENIRKSVIVCENSGYCSAVYSCV